MPAYGADALTPLNFKGIYEFSYAGMPLGKAGFEAEQSATGYDMTADVVTTGLVKLFTKHSSHTTVSAEGAAYSYPNITYESRYRTRKKARSAKLVYKKGVLAEEQALPPESRDRRPEVPAELKKNAHDLLTVNLKMRQGLWDAVKSAKPSFSLKAYDGRRLTQLDLTVEGKRTILYNGKKTPVIAMSARRKLLAGYTESERKDYDPKEPTLYIYYSDDARFIPLKLEVTFLFDKLSATLAKECRTGESCLFGIKE